MPSGRPKPAETYRSPCDVCGGELVVQGVDFNQTVGCPHCGEYVVLRFQNSTKTEPSFAPTNVIYPKTIEEEHEELIGDLSKHRYLAASCDMPLACVTAVVLAVQLEPFGSVVQGVASVVIFFLYYLVFEGVFGRTPGKYLFSLRVVSMDGKPASWRQIVIRTLWRFLEVNPLLIGGLPAAVFIFISRTHRRVGDFFAKTLVVFEGG